MPLNSSKGRNVPLLFPYCKNSEMQGIQTFWGENTENIVMNSFQAKINLK